MKKTLREQKETAKFILKQKKGIVLIDGPSGSGKSVLLDTLMKQKEKAIRFSVEKITEKILGCIRENGTCVAMKSIENELRDYEIIGIEDIDLSYAKEITMKCVAEIAKMLAVGSLVIFTGIDVERKMPYFIDNLNKLQFVYLDCETGE